MNEKPLISIIDDDADFIEINRRMLSGRGYEVECFSCPEEAMSGMRERPPALAVTDLMMGALDSGFSLVREMRNDPVLRKVPVIIVSGMAHQRGYDFSPKSGAELNDMGADAFFHKPVNAGAFLAKVGELLGGAPERGT